MKTLFLIILFLSLVFVGTPVCLAASSDHIGIVKSLAGDVVIVRSDKTIKAEPNMKLIKGDLVITGTDGKVGLIFEDDTVISMGSNSKILIENFIFQPSEKKLSFIAKFFKRTASILSGQIATLAPEMFCFETPLATVGIRGTHFLVKVNPD